MSDKPALVRALPSLPPPALADDPHRYQRRLASLLAVDEAVARDRCRPARQRES